VGCPVVLASILADQWAAWELEVVLMAVVLTEVVLMEVVFMEVVHMEVLTEPVLVQEWEVGRS